MTDNPLVNPEIEVSPEHTKELLDAGEAVVIDVREPYERDAGHIDGSEHIERIDHRLHPLRLAPCHTRTLLIDRRALSMYG